jgi:hypothetical protein
MWCNANRRPGCRKHPSPSGCAGNADSGLATGRRYACSGLAAGRGNACSGLAAGRGDPGAGWPG